MVAKAEGILNSKPISPLINDPQGLDPLTPRHFIIGTPLVDLPTPSLLKYYESLIDRWKNNSVKVRFLPPLSLLLYLFIVFFKALLICYDLVNNLVIKDNYIEVRTQ